MKRNFNELLSEMSSESRQRAEARAGGLLSAINVTIVVSGQPVAVAVNVRKRLKYVLTELLNECGNKGQPVGDWELRRTDGSLIDPSMTPRRAKISGGMTLYLSPRAGAGADFDRVPDVAKFISFAFMEQLMDAARKESADGR